MKKTVHLRFKIDTNTLLNVDNWTERDEELVDKHFAKLQVLLKEPTILTL